MHQTYLGNKWTSNISRNFYQPVIGCKLFICISFLFTFGFKWFAKLSFPIEDMNISTNFFCVSVLVFCHLSDEIWRPIWTASWQNQHNDSAPSEDSDQPGHWPSLISLRCVLNGYLRTQAFFMRTAKTLLRLGGCPGWSESSLGAHSFCWFWRRLIWLYFIPQKPCLNQFTSY